MPNSATKRILVVDDEPPMCLLLSMLLMRHGYDVEVANSAAQAIEKFDRHTFDAVFTDFIMDPTNGEDLARQIKLRSPRKPIVMITGFPPRIPSPAVDVCIAKPFNNETLSHTLAGIFAEP